MGRNSSNCKLKTSGVTISRHSANPKRGLIERKIDAIRVLWEQDHNTPDGLSSERLACPFGISDGAWVVWQFCLAKRLVRIGVV